MAGSPRYLELLREAEDLHIAKNAGYAGADNPDAFANFRMSEAFGVDPFRGALVRMSDKYIRVTNLVKDPNNDQVGESIIDTLKDLAAYALIAVCLYEEQNREPEVLTTWVDHVFEYVPTTEKLIDHFMATNSTTVCGKTPDWTKDDIWFSDHERPEAVVICWPCRR